MEFKYLEDKLRPSFTFTRTVYRLVSNDELKCRYSSVDGMKRMLHVVKAKASLQWISVNWVAGYNFSSGADQRKLWKGFGTTEGLLKAKLTEIHQYSLWVFCYCQYSRGYFKNSSPQKCLQLFQHCYQHVDNSKKCRYAQKNVSEDWMTV